MGPKRWQDWANTILGLWMFVSPWILGFSASSVPARTAWILGIAIIVFAGIAVYIPKAWEEALNIILGVCLIISPWALGYTGQSRAGVNAIIIGFVVTVLAIWAMLLDTTIQKWWHARHPTQ
jgi:hypothetical protein